jgi:hypothetical protein
MSNKTKTFCPNGKETGWLKTYHGSIFSGWIESVKAVSFFLSGLKIAFFAKKI